MNNATTKRHPAANGSKWIRPAKRLAIYLRDGLACVWCGHTLEDGERFQLDHLKCWSQGGSNEATNLVTACAHCNAARGNRTRTAFARAVAEYTLRETPAEILRRIKRTTRRRLPMEEAKRIIARR